MNDGLAGSGQRDRIVVGVDGTPNSPGGSAHCVVVSSVAAHPVAAHPVAARPVAVRRVLRETGTDER